MRNTFYPIAVIGLALLLGNLTPSFAQNPVVYNGKLLTNSAWRHSDGLRLYTMNSDGSRPRQITNAQKERTAQLPLYATAYDGGGAFSPDGNQIAFLSNRDDTVDLYLMNADGSSVRRILRESEANDMGAISWSRDGRKLAFSAGRRLSLADSSADIPPPQVSIYTLNPDGSNLQKITDGSVDDRPSWTPDGRIVFDSVRGGRHGVWIMNADGSNIRQVTPSRSDRYEQEDFQQVSPDGQRILYEAYRRTQSPNIGVKQLYSSKIDGTDERQLTYLTFTIYFDAVWSPDGRQIAFSSILGDSIEEAEQSGAYGVFVMNADGTNVTRITYGRLTEVPHPATTDYLDDWQPLTTPSTEVPAAVLGFDKPSYQVSEGAGRLQVTVTRTGDVSEAASCEYYTEDASATIRRNYTPAFGTLTFGVGEMSKSFSIGLIDNGLAQGSVGFRIKLNNNEGNVTFVGANRDVSVTIADNDLVSSPVNPIDDARAFVRQQYLDFLNREPDPSGWDFWTNQILVCGTDAKCIDAKRQNVSAAFFLSIEFQETGYWVYRLGQLTSAKGVDLRSFFSIIQRVGREVIVGQAGWEQKLEANKQAYLKQLFDDEYVYLALITTNENYVDVLFRNARITPTTTERNALVAGLNTGSETRLSVFRKILENPAYQHAAFNAAFVKSQYFGYLRRNSYEAPDSAEEEGYNFWLRKMNAANGDYQKAEMVRAFLVSDEYRQRFGTK